MQASFTVAVRFLSGRCVAAQFDDRKSPEWPIHPARLFMAAVDCLHAFGNQPRQRAALEWLECQPSPIVTFVHGDLRNDATHYVPVNDSAAHPGAGPLTTLEGTLQRKRQPRAFPATILGEPCNEGFHLAYTWASKPAPDIGAALTELFSGISYLGQSTSPVCILVNESCPQLQMTLAPGNGFGGRVLRVPKPGLLAQLEAAYSDAEGKYAAKVSEARAAVASADKKTKKTAESALKKVTNDVPEERGRPQGWGNAVYSLIRSEGRDLPPPVASKFAEDFTILSFDEGPVCGLHDTIGLTDLLRSAAMAAVSDARGQVVPRWLSGHEADGSSSRSTEPHTAFVALPFAGWPHADGSIKGLAIMRPRGLSAADDRLLSALFFDADGEEKTVKLVAGNAGAWELSREARPKPPRTLTRETWTAAPHGAYEWATVTPFAFDRMPKARIHQNNGAEWDVEVSGIIGEACKRIGLPVPESVQASLDSWLEGVPRADEFPRLPTRAGQPARLLRHIIVRFPVPVTGPVLLGAGRFKGYGLLKPI